MIVAHIMGIPIEESVLQLAPAGGALLTAVAIAGRTRLGSLRRRLGHLSYGTLRARFRLALGRHEVGAYHLEPAGPILIRLGAPGDEAALDHLVALDSRRLREGLFLLAEVDGELVAAAPLDVDAESLSDPLWPTANLRQLLRLQAARVRRHRNALAPTTEEATAPLFEQRREAIRSVSAEV